MLKAILDSDILSEIGKGINPNVLRNVSEYLDEHPKLTFTSVSIYEVLYGFRVKSATTQMREFLVLIAPHEEIAPTAQDYRTAAEIRAALHVAGTPIGIADPVIAACAIRRKLPLITGNTRHHSYIQKAGFSLTLINWREA